jgi:hypothetical protein
LVYFADMAKIEALDRLGDQEAVALLEEKYL